LSAWSGGDPRALDELMPHVYAELHRLARYHWSSQPKGHTLQPTALIHEAYMKLAGQGDKSFTSKNQFFALASMAMRQILVNHAEASMAQKRGGGQENVSLSDVEQAVHQEAREVMALHDALTALQALDARKAQVVEARYFGGLSIEETAEALGISPVTVTREWQAARLWLAREMGNGTGEA
jgi:RNA polymerase sigma factor (TIGR02999 family)